NCALGSFIGEPWMRAHQEQWMSHLRTAISAYRRATSGPRTGSVGAGSSEESPWSFLQRNVRQCMPEVCRRRTLVVVNHLSPYYVNQWGPLESADYFAMSTRLAQATEQTGLAVTEIGKDSPRQFYRDHCHLTIEGGWRMAEETSRKVRHLARRLGYVN